MPLSAFQPSVLATQNLCSLHRRTVALCRAVYPLFVFKHLNLCKINFLSTAFTIAKFKLCSDFHFIKAEILLPPEYRCNYFSVITEPKKNSEHSAFRFCFHFKRSREIAHFIHKATIIITATKTTRAKDKKVMKNALPNFCKNILSVSKLSAKPQKKILSFCLVIFFDFVIFFRLLTISRVMKS